MLTPVCAKAFCGASLCIAFRSSTHVRLLELLGLFAVRAYPRPTVFVFFFSGLGVGGITLKVLAMFPAFKFNMNESP